MKVVVTAAVAALMGVLPAAPAQGAPTCFGRPATLVGTRGEDRLVGTARRDVIVGRGGRDEIAGLGGDDLICAGDETDSITGGRGDDRINGQGAGDFLYGGPGNDLLKGGGRNGDHFEGGAGHDVMRSPPGQSGALYYSDSPSPVIVDLRAKRAGGWGNDRFSGTFTYVAGSPFDDVIRGSELREQLSGMSGNDEIIGGGGDDLISGSGTSVVKGSDDDVLRGGLGNDQIDGNQGADEIYGEDGNDQLAADLCRDGEPCPGNTGDSLFGGAGDDILDTWDQEPNDTADAGDGSDTCVLDEGDAVTDCEEQDVSPIP